MVHIPEDMPTMLGKRGNDLEDDLWLKYLSLFDNHFTLPEDSAAAHPSSSSPPSGPDHESTDSDVEKPPPSVPEKPPQSPESLTESEYEMVEKEDVPPWTGGSSKPASSTMSNADQESVGAHALPSDHESTEVHGPLLNSVFPTWFHPDHGSIGADAPLEPNLGPSTESDSDHGFLVEEPPSRPASPTESDHDSEAVDVPPST